MGRGREGEEGREKYGGEERGRRGEGEGKEGEAEKKGGRRKEEGGRRKEERGRRKQAGKGLPLFSVLIPFFR
jgi:hypothetical protein